MRMRDLKELLWGLSEFVDLNLKRVSFIGVYDLFEINQTLISHVMEHYYFTTKYIFRKELIPLSASIA